MSFNVFYKARPKRIDIEDSPAVWAILLRHGGYWGAIGRFYRIFATRKDAQNKIIELKNSELVKK